MPTARPLKKQRWRLRAMRSRNWTLLRCRRWWSRWQRAWQQCKKLLKGKTRRLSPGTFIVKVFYLIKWCTELISCLCNDALLNWFHACAMIHYLIDFEPFILTTYIYTNSSDEDNSSSGKKTPKRKKANKSRYFYKFCLFDFIIVLCNHALNWFHACAMMH